MARIPFGVFFSSDFTAVDTRNLNLYSLMGYLVKTPGGRKGTQYERVCSLDHRECNFCDRYCVYPCKDMCFYARFQHFCPDCERGKGNLGVKKVEGGHGSG